MTEGIVEADRDREQGRRLSGAPPLDRAVRYIGLMSWK